MGRMGDGGPRESSIVKLPVITKVYVNHEFKWEAQDVTEGVPYLGN